MVVAIAFSTPTFVVSPPTPLVVHFRRESQDRDRLEGLVAISERHAERGDTLSKKLLRSITLLCSSVVEGNMEAVALEVHNLQKNVLMNPLDGSLLRNPVIERDTIWEKWMLDHCRGLSLLSPYDSQPFGPEEPHLFAQEVIGWVALVRGDPRLPALDPLPGEGLSEEEVKAADPVTAWRGYYDLAQSAQQREDKESLIAVLERGKRDFIAVTEATERRCREQIGRTKRALEEREVVVEARIREIEGSYSQVVGDLKKRLSESRRDVAVLEDRVVKTEEHAALLKGQLDSLTSQIHSLRGEVGQLQCEVANSSGGGGCSVV